MDLSYKNLTSIPNVGNIKTLYIDYNQIVTLENLPIELTKLYINYNQIKVLENLPKSLKILSIYNNQISKLENFPKGLTELYISNNQIVTLENLPKGLIELYISNNQISKLKNLPKELTTLYIGRNQINNITNLPEKLTELYIAINPFNPEMVEVFTILGININNVLYKKDLDKLRKVFYLQKCIKRYYKRRFNAGAIINRWIYSIIWDPRMKNCFMVRKNYRESIEIIND